MKIKIGVIGACDTVNKVKAASDEFKSKADIYIYPYSHKDEIFKILEESEAIVDIILFSGQVPYNLARKMNLVKKPYYFIPFTGATLYKAFWEMKGKGIDYERVSFDTIEKKDVMEIAEELSLASERFYINDCHEDIDYDEVTKFHYELWKKEEVNVACTCLNSTYIKLKNLGMPVIRLFPTVSLIKEYLNKIIYDANIAKAKSAQIAVQIIKINHDYANMSSEYSFLELRNTIEKHIINYTKIVIGSMFLFGRNEYLIFTTRGAINDEVYGSSIKELVVECKKNKVNINSGIGFGSTIYEAEVNARIGLSYSEKNRDNCLYMVSENGLITGPLCSDYSEYGSYHLTSFDEKIKEISTNTNLSSAYISKIKSIINSKNKNTFNAEEFSNYLGISVRSSRRILNQLVDGGYAKIVGEGKKNNTGRPYNIYEIKFY
ncbi:hypothetical protein [Lutispora saccharofermentans]|uniref:Transcriptional regulator n=1 Tax=Lutispora saccharofermentans TaxID=3024236 RepID=A0ABT1NGE4_9FIRM|nr:hypothetical protein [Lutispora saccharofermentans]MCQ1530294.1 hypothetical protein [Lutispora saccharofermentans]